MTPPASSPHPPPPALLTDASFDLPPTDVTPAQLYVLMQQLNTKQSLLLHENTQTNRRIASIEADTADMVAAWKAGGTVLRIVKWSALVGTAVLSVWKFAKGVH